MRRRLEQRTGLRHWLHGWEQRGWRRGEHLDFEGCMRRGSRRTPVILHLTTTWPLGFRRLRLSLLLARLLLLGLVATATPGADLPAHAASKEHAPERAAGRKKRQRQQQRDEAAEYGKNHERARA